MGVCQSTLSALKKNETSLKELHFFKHRYVTPLHQKFQTLISRLNFKSNPPPWGVEMMIADQCISPFGPNYRC